jgi:hypothetical protein
MDTNNSINTGGGSYVGGDVEAGRDFIGRDHNNYNLNLPPAPVTALHQLPPPPGDFTGRTEELAELLNAVQASGVTISGLHGMGGVGKTTLALKLAEQLTSRYGDGDTVSDEIMHS